MIIYLAGENGKTRFLKEIIEGGGQDMNIYLAGEHPVKNGRFAIGGGAENT